MFWPDVELQSCWLTSVRKRLTLYLVAEEGALSTGGYNVLPTATVEQPLSTRLGFNPPFFFSPSTFRLFSAHLSLPVIFSSGVGLLSAFSHHSSPLLIKSGICRAAWNVGWPRGVLTLAANRLDVSLIDSATSPRQAAESVFAGRLD